MEWLYQLSQWCNLLLCHSQGILLYKVDHDTTETRLYRSLGLPIQNLWFEVPLLSPTLALQRNAGLQLAP